MRALRRDWPIAIPWLVLIALLHAWLGPGAIQGEDFRAFGWIGMPVLSHALPWPSAWDPTLGFGTSLQLWVESFPLMWLAGWMTHFGASWSMVERVCILFPLLFFIVASPYYLARRVFNSSFAAALCALSFSINTYTVSLVQRGHLPALVAYSFLPLGIAILLRALASGRWATAILYAFTIEIQFIFELRYAYLAILCGLAVMAVSWARGDRRAPLRQVRVMVSVGATLGIANLYWILPTALYRPEVPTDFSALAAFIQATRAESLIDAFANFHPYYHHVLSSDDFGATSVEPGFIAFSLVAVAGYIADRRRPLTQAFSVIWAAAIVFVAGATWIVAPLNEWIFEHVPGMFLFRESAKLMSLTSLCVSYGVAAFVSNLDGVGWLGRWRERAVIVASFGLGVALIVLMGDSFNPLRFSNFAAYPAFRADEVLTAYLANVASPGRVVYFPDTPLGVSPTSKNPAVSSGYQFDWKYPPFGIANLAVDPTSSYGALASAAAPSLMCSLGIRYLVVDPDPFSALYEPWYFNVTRGEAIQYFAKRSWLTRVFMEQGRIPARSRYVVFRMKSCSGDPGVPYLASRPITYDGSTSSLDSLQHTSLWGPGPGVLVAAQQPGAIPLVHYPTVLGEFILDPAVIRRRAVALRISEAAYTEEIFRAASALRNGRTPIGAAVSRSAASRASGPGLDVGSVRAAFRVGAASKFYLYSTTRARFDSRGIIWLHRFDGRLTSRMSFDVPLAEHPVLQLGLVRRIASLPPIRYLLSGPNGERQVITQRVRRGMRAVDLYDVVESWVLANRAAAIRQNARRAYSNPSADAADYTLRGVVLSAPKRLVYAAIGIPETVLAAPQPIDVVPHRSTASEPPYSITVRLQQPPRVSALAFDVLGLHGRAARFRLSVYDRATRKSTHIDVDSRNLYGCYACSASWNVRQPNVPLGVPQYSVPTVPNGFLHVVVPVPPLLQTDPPLLDPRVTGLKILFNGHQRATEDPKLANVAFRRWRAVDPYAVGPPLGPSIDGSLWDGPRTLRSGSHTLTLRSTTSFHSESALLISAAIVPRKGTYTPTHTSFSEVVGALVGSPGLFVFPETYSGGWRLALVPRGVPITGDVYVDAILLHQYMLPQWRHVIVNGAVNGWDIPATDGHAVLIFMPTVSSALGALLSISIFFIVLARAWARNRTG